jgi:hypothetical protein
MKNRKWLLLLLALVMVITASIPSAMAYFTGYTQVEGRRRLEFSTPPELHELFHDWVKSVTIKNTKGADIFVRARAYKGDNINLEYTPEAGWTFNTADGWWYYDAPLAKDQTTSVLLITIKDVPADVVDGSNALVKAWAAPIAGNVLKGAAEDIEAAGKYVLAKVDGKVCFYLATSGTIKAGKAYLDIASDVKAFYFGFDEATGIEMVNGQWSTANGQSIYNLAGQRLQKMQRGINITAGKKILK